MFEFLRKTSLSLPKAGSIEQEKARDYTAALARQNECQNAYERALVKQAETGGPEPTKERKALSEARQATADAALALEAAHAIRRAADSADAAKRRDEHLAAIDREVDGMLEDAKAVDDAIATLATKVRAAFDRQTRILAMSPYKIGGCDFEFALLPQNGMLARIIQHHLRFFPGFRHSPIELSPGQEQWAAHILRKPERNAVAPAPKLRPTGEPERRERIEWLGLRRERRGAQQEPVPDSGGRGVILSDLPRVRLEADPWGE